jgi:hypothetical protein
MHVSVKVSFEKGFLCETFYTAGKIGHWRGDPSPSTRYEFAYYRLFSVQGNKLKFDPHLTNIYFFCKIHFNYKLSGQQYYFTMPEGVNMYVASFNTFNDVRNFGDYSTTRLCD